MKTSLLIIILFLSGSIYGQTEEVYTKVDKMPEFPGGQVALVKYISKNLKYPASAKNGGISGKVRVSFIIDKMGNVTHAEVSKGLSPDCDNEALRVVQSMPRWTPGQKDGNPVPVQFVLPISFELSE